MITTQRWAEGRPCASPPLRAFAFAFLFILCAASLYLGDAFTMMQGVSLNTRSPERAVDSRRKSTPTTSVPISAAPASVVEPNLSSVNNVKVDAFVELLPQTSPVPEKCQREHQFTMDGFTLPLETLACDEKAVENPTSIKCSFRKFEYFESFCLAENVVVDTKAFDVYISGPPENANDPSHYAPQPVQRMHGVLTSTGVCDIEIKDHARYGGGGTGVFTYGFESAKTAEMKRVIARESEHVVYVIAGGYGSGNPWHELEQIVNLYEVMLAHHLPRDGGRVVIFDSFKRQSVEDVIKFHSPVYGELIKRVFSSNFPLTTMGLYIDEKRAQNGVGADETNQTILFDRMAFVPSGGTSKLSRGGKGESLGCTPSPVITSFISLVMDKLPEVKAVEATLDAVFIVRGVQTSNRRVVSRSYEELLNRVKDNPKVKVVDFAEVGDIIEQMKIVRSAKALVGQHGAGLTHALWMHQGSKVIEIADGFRCHCYTAISNFAGHEYQKISSGANDLASSIITGLGLH
jgi:hypothetical protein